LSPLRDYFLLEARHAPRKVPIAMALWGVLAIPGTHALVVRLPTRVIRFMEEAFLVKGMAAVLVANDLVAVYFATFFAGITGLLSTLVAAREEHRLEILLAKPVSPTTLVLARAAPVLVSSAVAGALVAAATALSIRPYLAPDDPVSVGGALGGGLFLVALALVLLAALTPFLVQARDGLHALLVASVVWLAPMIPTAVLIYRPDLFEGRAPLRSTIVLITLVWHDSVFAWLGPLALGGALLWCVALISLAGRVLARRGVGG